MSGFLNSVSPVLSFSLYPWNELSLVRMWMRPTTHFLCRGATSLPVTTMRKPYSWFQTASCWRRIWPNWIAWRNGFKKSRRKTKHSNQSPAEGHLCPLEKSVVEACCSTWCWKNFDRTQNYGRQTLNACLGLIKVRGDTRVLWDMLEHEWKPSFNQDLRIGWTHFSHTRSVGGTCTFNILVVTRETMETKHSSIAAGVK